MIGNGECMRVCIHLHTYSYSLSHSLPHFHTHSLTHSLDIHNSINTHIHTYVHIYSYKTLELYSPSATIKSLQACIYKIKDAVRRTVIKLLKISVQCIWNGKMVCLFILFSTGHTLIYTHMHIHIHIYIYM